MRAEGLRDISLRESVARAGEPDITISRENAPAQARTSEEVAISRESTLALAVARKRETRGERERERDYFVIIWQGISLTRPASSLHPEAPQGQRTYLLRFTHYLHTCSRIWYSGIQ